MNLLINGKMYELQEGAANIEGEEIINDGLEYCRKMISGKLFGDYVERIIFDGVYTYDSMEVNALACHQGGVYYIAISYGYFIRSYNWFNLWEKHPQIDEIFCFEDDNTKNNFFTNCYIWGIMFVLSHEMCHILDGHCMLTKKGNSIVETSKQREENENIFFQALEYDADFSATRICMSSILSMSSGKTSLIINVRNYLFALYNVFLLFAQADGDDFEDLINDEYEKYDHPSSSIRIDYCLSATMDYLSNSMEYRDIIPLYYQIVNDCISFDKIILNHKKLKECLFTYGYTQKGSKHIKIIHNKCRKIAKVLRKYASMPIHDYPILTNLPCWVNNEGEFIMKELK